jgi:hypothetical protein
VPDRVASQRADRSQRELFKQVISPDYDYSGEQEVLEQARQRTIVEREQEALRRAEEDRIATEQAAIEEAAHAERHRVAAEQREIAERAAKAQPTTGGGLPDVLRRIAICESGPDGHFIYRDHGHSNSTASGKYGFLDRTWGGFGGYARAFQAPESVQDQAAINLYNSQGTRPWTASVSCWN